MSFHFVIFGILGGLIVFALLLVPSESAIPPTPAFYQINVDGINVTSSNYKDTIFITTDNSIIATGNNTINEINFSLNYPTLTSIGGVFSSSCTVGKIVTGFDSSGYPYCEDLPSPTPTRLGGVFSSACNGSQTVYGISNNGTMMCR